MATMTVKAWLAVGPGCLALLRRPCCSRSPWHCWSRPVRVALWFSWPVWQLVVRTGRVDDVVARFDRAGPVLQDAGYTVDVPWASLASVRIKPGRKGALDLVPVVHGRVTGSRDPLAWLVVRGLRKGVLTLGLGPDDPSPQTIRAEVPELSAGRLQVG